ncbi:hypothetical protein ACVWZ4_004511 [Bradyrhizobium sp. USDA 4472]
MTTAIGSASIASRLIGRVADWLGQLLRSADIRALGTSEVESIARDLRIPRAELETLIAHSRQGAKELPQLLEALGIDEGSIADKEPGVLRDLTLVCSLCSTKFRCNREMQAGTAALHYPEYCANSYTIDALRKKPSRPETIDLLRGPGCC